MKIGNLTLEAPVILSPMAGITDLPFRLLCREQGAALVTTEMVSAKGMFYRNENTHKLLSTLPEERPVAVQLFGSDPVLLGEMAARLNDEPVDVLDVNMGCPAPKVVKNGEGSALLKDPAKIEAMVAAMTAATQKPVTVKIRKGFALDEELAVEAALAAERGGAAAVAVHGRTREQYYSGQADWGCIARVKAALSIPVIGNGDVTGPEEAARMLRETGCDAVSIGRAAQGDPWIFARVRAFLERGERLPLPTPAQRRAMALRHLHMLVDYKGEYTAVREMRTHLGHYAKGLPRAAEFRREINAAESQKRLEELICGHFSD